jgi:DNA-binding transcriptional LysR family regulator
MQSTVGRRLAALEGRLGVRLLTRTSQGYVVTSAGESILEGVERVESEALAIARLIGGRDVRLEGTVSVTSVGAIASHVLAPCFARLHLQHPEITIELRPDTGHLGLPMREIDVVVRLTRLKQHEYLVRRVGSLAFGIYASLAYIKRHGELDFDSGCSGHRLILPLDDTETQTQVRWFTNAARAARVVLKTSDWEAQLNAVLSGDGVACLPRFYADNDPRLQRLSANISIPPAEIWLATHRDNRQIRRIRTVIECIVQGMRDHMEVLDPLTPVHHPPTGVGETCDFSEAS